MRYIQILIITSLLLNIYQVQGKKQNSKHQQQDSNDDEQNQNSHTHMNINYHENKNGKIGNYDNSDKIHINYNIHNNSNKGKDKLNYHMNYNIHGNNKGNKGKPDKIHINYNIHDKRSYNSNDDKSNGYIQNQDKLNKVNINYNNQIKNDNESNKIQPFSIQPSANLNWQNYHLSQDYQKDQSSPFYYITQKLNQKLKNSFNSQLLKFTNVQQSSKNQIQMFKIQFLQKLQSGQINLLEGLAEYDSISNQVSINNLRNIQNTSQINNLTETDNQQQINSISQNNDSNDIDNNLKVNSVNESNRSEELNNQFINTTPSVVLNKVNQQQDQLKQNKLSNNEMNSQNNRQESSQQSNHQINNMITNIQQNQAAQHQNQQDNNMENENIMMSNEKQGSIQSQKSYTMNSTPSLVKNIDGYQKDQNQNYFSNKDQNQIIKNNLQNQLYKNSSIIKLTPSVSINQEGQQQDYKKIKLDNQKNSLNDELKQSTNDQNKSVTSQQVQQTQLLQNTLTISTSPNSIPKVQQYDSHQNIAAIHDKNIGQFTNDQLNSQQNKSLIMNTTPSLVQSNMEQHENQSIGISSHNQSMNSKELNMSNNQNTSKDSQQILIQQISQRTNPILSKNESLKNTYNSINKDLENQILSNKNQISIEKNDLITNTLPIQMHNKIVQQQSEKSNSNFSKKSTSFSQDHHQQSQNFEKSSKTEITHSSPIQQFSNYSLMNIDQQMQQNQLNMDITPSLKLFKDGQKEDLFNEMTINKNIITSSTDQQASMVKRIQNNQIINTQPGYIPNIIDTKKEIYKSASHNSTSFHEQSTQVQTSQAVNTLPGQLPSKVVQNQFKSASSNSSFSSHSYEETQIQKNAQISQTNNTSYHESEALSNKEQYLEQNFNGEQNGINPLELIQQELERQIYHINKGTFVQFSKENQQIEDGDNNEIIFSFKLPNGEIKQGTCNAYYLLGYLRISNLKLDQSQSNQSSQTNTLPSINWEQEKLPYDQQQNQSSIYHLIQTQIQNQLNTLDKSKFIRFDKIFFQRQDQKQYYKVDFTCQTSDGKPGSGEATLQYIQEEDLLKIKELKIQNQYSTQDKITNFQQNQSIIPAEVSSSNNKNIITSSTQPMPFQDVSQLNIELNEQLQLTYKYKLTKIVSIVQTSSNSQTYSVIFEYELPSGQVQQGNCEAFYSQNQIKIKDLNILKNQSSLIISPNAQTKSEDWQDYQLNDDYQSNPQSPLFLITQLLIKNLMISYDAKFIKFDKILYKNQEDSLQFKLIYSYQIENEDQQQSSCQASYNQKLNQVSISDIQIQYNHKKSVHHQQPVQVNPSQTQEYQQIISNVQITDSCLTSLISQELSKYVKNQYQGKITKLDHIEKLTCGSNSYQVEYTYENNQGSKVKSSCIIDYNSSQNSVTIQQNGDMNSSVQQIKIEQLESEALVQVYEEVINKGYEIVNIKLIDSSFEVNTNIGTINIQLIVQNGQKQLYQVESTVEVQLSIKQYKIIKLDISPSQESQQDSIKQINQNPSPIQPQNNINISSIY